MQRWLASHNRKQDLARVTLLFDEVIDFIEKKGSKNELILAALGDSIVGLKNLKTTYEEDITSVSAIEYIMELSTPFLESKK
jgi:hypothetical protein